MLSIEEVVRDAYPGYITVAEFVKRTGYSQSRAYTLIQDGEVEHIKVKTGCRRGYLILVKDDPKMIDTWKRRYNAYWYGLPDES